MAAQPISLNKINQKDRQLNFVNICDNFVNICFMLKNKTFYITIRKIIK